MNKVKESISSAATIKSFKIDNHNWFLYLNTVLSTILNYHEPIIEY